VVVHRLTAAIICCVLVRGAARSTNLDGTGGRIPSGGGSGAESDDDAIHITSNAFLASLAGFKRAMADKRLRPATANLRGAGATSPAIQGGAAR
jgi:hypothetical protein